MMNHRKKRQFDCLDLPPLKGFDEDEKLLAQVIIGIVRRKGALFYGRFIECIVARLLGARFPQSGISRWDLLLPDSTRIEVRSGDKSFSLKGNKDVHLWVFVHKSSPNALFSVASAKAVKALKVKSITAKKLREQFKPVGASELETEVAAVRGGTRRLRIA
jgi:hypothetical protein